MSKHQVVSLVFGIFTVIFVIGILALEWPLWPYLIGLFIWLFIVARGSLVLRWQYHIKAVLRHPTQQKVVAITFDDGPTEYTPQILTLLKGYHFKATFFCIGKQVEQNQKILQQIQGDGHLIGNHSFSHAINNGFKSKRKALAEIEKTDALIEQVTGQKPLYFRPPFGATSPNIRRALKLTGHTPIGWTIQPFDTMKANPKEKILKEIKQQLKPGSIILLHDISEKAVQTLKELLVYLEEQGYKSISVEELLSLRN